MRLTTTSVSEHLVLRLDGELAADDAAELGRRLGAAVATDAHELVICDVSRLRRADPLAVRVFATQQDPDEGPGPRLCLVGASGEVAEVLERLGIPRFLPTASSVEAALARERSGPPRLSAARLLLPSPAAPRLARRFVAETCAQWGVIGVVEDAELIADELVTNAVVHAGTEVALRLERTPTSLMVAVRDLADDTFATWWHGDEDERGTTWGTGLTLVRALADSAGVHLEATGGKAVWAVLHTSAPDTPEPGMRPRRTRLTVNAGRRPREETRWRVMLDLLWVPERPELVRLTLTSRPKHPSLMRGSWWVARSALRDGLRGPVRHEGLRVRPERGGRELVLEVPARPVQVLRVSASRVGRFLDSTADHTSRPGTGWTSTTAATGSGP